MEHFLQLKKHLAGVEITVLSCISHEFWNILSFWHHEDILYLISKDLLPFLFSSKQRTASILQYGCTTWTLTKCMEKKLDGKLHKNAESNMEQVLEAAPHKAAAVATTDHPSWKPSKLDEPGIRVTAEDVRMST